MAANESNAKKQKQNAQVENRASSDAKEEFTFRNVEIDEQVADLTQTNRALAAEIEELEKQIIAINDLAFYIIR